MRIADTIRKYFVALWGNRLEQILKDRRISPRKPCEIHGIHTFQNGSRLPLVAKDIGKRGMLIETYKRLVPGSHLLVSTTGDTRAFQRSRYDSDDVYMTVLWCRKNDESYEAGLRFNISLERYGNSWLAFLLDKHGFSGDGADYRRSAIRVSANIPLKWRVLGGEYDRSGTVTDISLDGMLIATEKKIPARESLWLRVGPRKSLKPLICRATVIHTVHSSDSGRYLSGLCFNRLDEDQTKLLRRYLVDLYLFSN